jgi:signal transduction histidine kinase/ActR/RegA family two-component response regulator
LIGLAFEAAAAGTILGGLIAGGFWLLRERRLASELARVAGMVRDETGGAPDRSLGRSSGIASHVDTLCKGALAAHGRAAEQAREVAHLYAVLRSLQHGVCVHDADLNLVYFTDGFPTLYELPRDRLTPGMSLRSLLTLFIECGHAPNHTVESLFANWRKVADDRQPGSGWRELGSGRRVSFSHSPLPGGGLVVVTESVADRLRFEHESRAQSRFLATMSHEIRTPLNGVLGMAATLLDTPLTEDQRGVVATIQDSGDHLLRILNDILDFAKISAGRLDFESVPFAPAALAETVAATMAANAEVKGIALAERQLDTLPDAVLGDPGRIRQVLFNLVSNAVKFTPLGAVTIESRLIAMDETHATIEWTVRDTGIGIARERLGLLFDAFSQADNTISRRFGGTGLGLAISRQLIAQMGGTIHVESEPGHGSCFQVRLTMPLARDEPVSDARPDTDAAWERLAGFGRDIHVLLAEDTPTNQLVIKRMLGGLPVRLDIVGDGLGAVAAAARSPPDLIFMDMQMPGLDGVSAARRIRASGGPESTAPMIALTANAFPEDVRLCQEAGMSGFVAKPVTRDRLLRAMVEALDTAREVA